MRKEERANELNNNGINVDAFIAMGLPEGAKVTIDLPGGVTQEIELLLKKFENMDAIKADPYFSRFTMAQVFDVLRSGKSVPGYLRCKFPHPYRYQFEQTLDRIKEVYKTPAGSERREILSKFFNENLAVELAEMYMKDLHNYVDSLPEKKHHGRPYKAIPDFATVVHTKDIERVVFTPLEKELDAMQQNRWRNPHRFILFFERFIKKMVKFKDEDLKLNEKFIAAYQGRGAYLTATGLIEFHGCRVYTHKTPKYYWSRGEKGAQMSKAESLEAIKNKVNEIDRSRIYWGAKSWYLLWGMMKEIVEDNGFDFYKAMDKKYNK